MQEAQTQDLQSTQDLQKARAREQRLETAFNKFLEMLPHCRETKLQLEYYKDAEICMSLPPQAQIIGNSDENLIHGGAITMLIDTTCGAMAMFATEKPESCPTLDLRVDHFKAAKGDQPVYCKAKLLRTTKRIVFVEARVEQADILIGKATATFMRIGNKIINDALEKFF